MTQYAIASLTDTKDQRQRFRIFYQGGFTKRIASKINHTVAQNIAAIENAPIKKPF